MVFCNGFLKNEREEAQISFLIFLNFMPMGHGRKILKGEGEERERIYGVMPQIIPKTLPGNPKYSARQSQIICQATFPATYRKGFLLPTGFVSCALQVLFPATYRKRANHHSMDPRFGSFLCHTGFVSCDLWVLFPVPYRFRFLCPGESFKQSKIICQTIPNNLPDNPK